MSDVMISTRALQAFFHPHDPAELARAARDGRRLFLRTDRPAAFAGFLPWATLNTLLSVEALVAGTQRAVRQGRDIPIEMLCPVSADRNARTLSYEALQMLCHQGLSLVLNAIDRQVPAIAAMNAMIERYLRCDVGTNAYASFHRDGAFKAHYDRSNVLILQLQGHKRWWCHGRIDRFPVQAKVIPRHEDLPPAEWEAVLAPGDMLFLPRGEIHRAAVEGENSLHLTVALVPPNGEDVLKWLGRRALDTELARRDVPALAGPEELLVVTDRLRGLLHRLVDDLDVADFLADQDRRRTPVRTCSLGLGQEPAPTLRVQPSLRRRVALPDAVGGEAVISLGEATVKLTGEEREMLALLLEQDSLSMAELAEALPGSDAAATVAALARKSLVFLLAE